MTRIYLVRHAEAEGNLYRIAHGHEEGLITDYRGPRQIRALAQRFRDILHIVPDQETNDLTKAFSFCMEQGRRELPILGATGGREDHAIGNIALLADYARQADVQMVTPYGVFNAVEGAATFDSMPRQQVSIFTIVPGTRISVRGLRYTPPAEGFRSWWCGTLNEAETDTFAIETDGPALLFRTFLRKA